MRTIAWKCWEVIVQTWSKRIDLSSEVVDAHCFEVIAEPEYFDTAYTFMKCTLRIFVLCV